ncbi:MAG: hypothetical protein ACOC56_01435 [Atribacterota bacterium]
MVARSRIKGHYVTRRADGTFKNWTSVGKSIARDRKRKAKNTPKKKGYGHTGDYKYKRCSKCGNKKQPTRFKMCLKCRKKAR